MPIYYSGCLIIQVTCCLRIQPGDIFPLNRTSFINVLPMRHATSCMSTTKLPKSSLVHGCHTYMYLYTVRDEHKKEQNDKGNNVDIIDLS